VGVLERPGFGTGTKGCDGAMAGVFKGLLSKIERGRGAAWAAPGGGRRRGAVPTSGRRRAAQQHAARSDSGQSCSQAGPAYQWEGGGNGMGPTHQWGKRADGWVWF
jgi:hypothetical protein